VARPGQQYLVSLLCLSYYGIVWYSYGLVPAHMYMWCAYNPIQQAAACLELLHSMAACVIEIRQASGLSRSCLSAQGCLLCQTLAGSCSLVCACQLKLFPGREHYDKHT
jgi:hypothetical protein